MGILLGTCALGLDRYCSFYDYWRPPTVSHTINFESFLYGFFLGGISTKIFELCFNKQHDNQKKSPNSLFVIAVLFFSTLLHIMFLGLFHFNSVESYVYILLLWAILFLFINKRLFWVCIGSGLIMTGLNICWYALILTIYPDAIREIWLINNLSGLFIFNVPIEEHFYIFSLGCVGSIMYKVVTGPVKNRYYLILSQRLHIRSLTPDRLNTADARESGSSMHTLSKWLRPYRLPLTVLLLVVGRMVIFGDVRVPVRRIFNLLQ